MIKTIAAIVRKIGVHNLVMLVILLIGVNCLSVGLGVIIRGASLSAFFPVATTSALVGWWVGSGRLRAWQAWIVILLLGVVLLSGGTAQLGTPLLSLARLIPSADYQLFQWMRSRIPADFSAVASAWNALLTQYAQLWGRAAHWAQGTIKGANSVDPVMRVLAWNLLVWPIAAWAGWFLRGRQALIGMAPALVLLALVGNYTGADTVSLWGLLSMTLLLMGLMRYEANMARWTSHGIDFAEMIQGDTIVAFASVTVTLAMLAWMLPLFSIKSITDAIREYQQQQQPRQNQSSQAIAKSLGLEQAPGPPSDFAPYSVSTMPNEHLIQAAPKLLQTPVMSIMTGELPSESPGQSPGFVPYHRWRSATYDVYTGLGWASSAADTASFAADATIFDKIPQGYRVLYQQIRFAGNGDGKLYWDGTLYSSDHSFEVGWRTRHTSGVTGIANPFDGADILGALSDADSYRVKSLLPNFSLEQLRAAPAVYPELIARRYLSLPDRVPERVLALARDLTAVPPTPYDQAVAIETYLRTTYPYTLDLSAPPPDRDVTDYFLFDLKKGYCDYFATAMVVLARAAGLPARIVIGYASGRYDPIAAKYDIVQADAHAWVEVYFSGMGWVEFEPTPGRPALTRSVVQGLPYPDQPLTTPQGTLQNILTGAFGRLNMLPSWSMLTALVLALVLLVFALQLGEYLLLTRIPTTLAVQWIYRGIYRLGRNPMNTSPPAETAAEFATDLQARLGRLSQHDYLGGAFRRGAVELDFLTDLYLRAIYTSHAPQKTEVRRALSAWRSLRVRLLVAKLMPGKGREW